MGTATLVGTGVVLFLGSLIQRVTGMGLALVASPLLVLGLGATTGVQMIQVVGLVVCLVSAWMLRRDINYGRVGILLAASLFGIVPGSWMARSLPSSWLMIVIGCITMAALFSTRLLQRSHVLTGRKGTAIAGGLSGFMNVAAGVGGPPMVIYANSTNWLYSEYVATVQLFFAGVNVLSLVGRGFPVVSHAAWIVVIVCSSAGLLLGHLVGYRIRDDFARKAVFIIALLGSLAAVVRGIMAL